VWLEGPLWVSHRGLQHGRMSPRPDPLLPEPHLDADRGTAAAGQRHAPDRHPATALARSEHAHRLGRRHGRFPAGLPYFPVCRRQHSRRGRLRGLRPITTARQHARAESSPQSHGSTGASPKRSGPRIRRDGQRRPGRPTAVDRGVMCTTRNWRGGGCRSRSGLGAAVGAARWRRTTDPARATGDGPRDLRFPDDRGGSRPGRSPGSSSGPAGHRQHLTTLCVAKYGLSRSSGTCQF
jgi:hypothetical protein